MAQENEYVSNAAETMLESSQDISLRTFMEGVEEAHRLRRGLEIRLERAEAAPKAQADELQAKDNALQVQSSELQAMDEEIARLKELLARK